MTLLDCAYDSLIDLPGGDSGELRTLRFSGHGMRVDVAVTGRATMTLAITVLPPRPVRIAMRGGQELTPVDTDEQGRVSIHGVRPGLMTLYVNERGDDRPTCRTAWIHV